MNFRNLVCTAFFVNVVWFTSIGETGRSLLSLRFKEHKNNCEKWANDRCIKWNEATILAIDNHKFSRKWRESLEIEKRSTIGQGRGGGGGTG